jgi:hypothetical protein
MVELLIAGRSHLRVRAGSANSQSNQFSIQLFRGPSDLLILQSTKELRKQKNLRFLLFDFSFFAATERSTSKEGADITS